MADQQALQVQAGQAIVNAPAQQQQALPQGSQARNLYLNYDENVASLQWDKLEKAQQVAVAKVAPLHVNLPTRGVRYSFSQVLQTELRKPMTIRLLAENTKVPSWTTRLGLAVLGFGVLWAIVAAVNRRRPASGHDEGPQWLTRPSRNLGLLHITDIAICIGGQLATFVLYPAARGEHSRPQVH